MTKSGNYKHWKHGFKGGINNVGSVAWSNARLRQLRAAAKRGGYRPPAISPQEYLEKLAASGGHCAVCGDSPKRSLHLDHCHATGFVRGFLCRSCNHALGMFHDNPDVVQSALFYLVFNRKAFSNGNLSRSCD